jgi:HPt (histidine-containing phosphotransfer) domain-containing protein
MTEHFDEAAFGALQGALGEEMVGMLMGKFLVQMQEKVEIMRTGVAERDMAAVRQQAHDLTSSAGSLGLGAMKDAASTCEFAIKDGEEDKALEIAQQLVDMAPDTVAAIKAKFPELA